MDGSTAEDRHAVSGYAFIINGGAVSWSAKHQSIILLSTTESEYVAATHTAREALWLHSLIEQLFEEKLNPHTMFSKVQSARLKRIISIMPTQNTSMYDIILFAEFSKWGLCD